MRGVTFGDKHSFRDFGLYLKSYPEIKPPKPRTVMVDIPGGNGSIDLTECLTGDVRYMTRTIKMVFLVIDARNTWPSVYSGIMDHLHGKRMRIIFDNDANYYYEGRLSVDEWNSDKKTSTITIEAEVDPYKLDIVSSLDEWEWDSFSFLDGIIREMKNMTVNGSLDVTIIGTKKPSVLNVTSSAAMTVTFGGKSYAIKSGKNVVPGIVIVEGENNLTFTGNGTITIDYRGGRL